jgi:hypothetical protein
MRYLIIASLALLASCTAPNTAERTLVANGYTDVEIRGYALFGCGEDDQFRTKFRATAPSGMTVDGVVCGGLFKGSTIRLT